MAIEPLVRQAISEKKLPGAVVLVGRGDRTLYEKAIGNRALVPAAEPMTLDTIFDLASLTKVVATTTSVMMLVEEGKIRLSDRVSTFIPGFERYGKGGHHDSPSDDAYVRAPSRRRSRRCLERLRHGDQHCHRRGAHRSAW